ncbi:hypothetical protein ACH347_14760 [Saccharopolyspora sp. 5N102]|uniref:hypothetical protein n=1 Tax=Saccharopolyspora sp. 5N102 TaxID=3375155 RepID=UPI0037A2B0D8
MSDVWVKSTETLKSLGETIGEPVEDLNKTKDSLKELSIPPNGFGEVDYSVVIAKAYDDARLVIEEAIKKTSTQTRLVSEAIVAIANNYELLDSEISGKK